MLQELIDQTAVKFDALRINIAVPVRNDARPGNRKTVRFEAHFRKQSDIFFIAVVMVACDFKIGCPFWVAFARVDDRRPFSIFIPSAFHLISRSRRAPQKSSGN